MAHSQWAALNSSRHFVLSTRLILTRLSLQPGSQHRGGSRLRSRRRRRRTLVSDCLGAGGRRHHRTFRYVFASKQLREKKSVVARSVSIHASSSFCLSSFVLRCCSIFSVSSTWGRLLLSPLPRPSVTHPWPPAAAAFNKKDEICHNQHLLKRCFGAASRGDASYKVKGIRT